MSDSVRSKYAATRLRLRHVPVIRVDGVIGARSNAATMLGASDRGNASTLGDKHDRKGSTGIEGFFTPSSHLHVMSIPREQGHVAIIFHSLSKLFQSFENVIPYSQLLHSIWSTLLSPNMHDHHRKSTAAIFRRTKTGMKQKMNGGRSWQRCS